MCCVLAITLTWASALLGQGIVVPIQSPADAVTQRIRAQAALIEAETRLQEQAARARAAYADAVRALSDANSKAVDLDVKRVVTYFDKKSNHQVQMWKKLEYQLESNRKPMIVENAKKLAVWERTVRGDLPKIRGGIRSGDLLNRMFMQIDSQTGLSSASSFSPQVTEQLKPLDDRMLRGLQLKRSSLNGPVAVSLDSPMPKQLSNWPYAFFAPAIRPAVTKVTEAAERLFQPGLSSAEKYDLDSDFSSQLAELKTAFIKTYPPGERKRLSTVEILRILRAEQFLLALERTVQTRAETSDGLVENVPPYFDLHDPEERNLATLMQYMMRHGIEFAPAVVGSEPLYDALFLKVRDFAIQLDVSPTRVSIMEPVIDLQLDEAVTDPNDQRILEDMRAKAAPAR